MMQLADTTPTPCRRPLGDIARDRLTGATCSRQRDAQYPVTRRARLVSRSLDANFLEFIRAGFHYSVIVRDGASTVAAGVCFRGPAAVKISGQPLPVWLHMEMMGGASTQTRQFRFRTGDRRADAKESENRLPSMTMNAMTAKVL
nr:hypothetical protein [uncultured Rhodopila sp.]